MISIVESWDGGGGIYYIFNFKRLKEKVEYLWRSN